MKWLAILLLLIPFSSVADNHTELDYKDFMRIPVLHEGRIKPMDSVARIMFKRISGHDALPGNSASAWFAGVLFDPVRAGAQKWFLVHSPDVLHMLSLPESAEGTYSYEELEGALASHTPLLKLVAAKDKKDQTAADQEVLRLFFLMNNFAEFMESFSLLMPLADIDPQVREKLGVKDNADVTYFDLLKIRQTLREELKNIVVRKQDHIDKYSAHEQSIASLMYRMDLLEAADKENALLRVIPSSWDESGQWFSPWSVIEKGDGSPASAALFQHWHLLAQAYLHKDAALWKAESEALSATPARTWALKLEVLYHRLNPLGISLALYILASVLGFVATIRRAPAILTASYGALLTGAGFHAAALCARMAILMRPPVGTLYESMIFVSFIASAFGLWLEQNKKNGEGLIITGLIASLLLACASVFAADEDTLGVLVAVLNTRFWLATHVVCITTGYGASLVAAMLAHIYLIKRTWQPASMLALLEQRIYRVAIVALFFTTVGTMLGGIWADQSWGRFWGWDPKENGALLIVLWLIWLLHGRVGGQISVLGFVIGMASLSIVVMLAWVGVNLLSVGLHSYGFTSVAANGLLIFCTTEAVFIVVTSIAIYTLRKIKHAA